MNELVKHKNAYDNYRSTKVLYHTASQKASHEKFIVPWQLDEDITRKEKAKK